MRRRRPFVSHYRARLSRPIQDSLFRALSYSSLSRSLTLLYLSLLPPLASAIAVPRSSNSLSLIPVRFVLLACIRTNFQLTQFLSRVPLSRPSPAPPRELVLLFPRRITDRRGDCYSILSCSLQEYRFGAIRDRWLRQELFSPGQCK